MSSDDTDDPNFTPEDDTDDEESEARKARRFRRRVTRIEDVERRPLDPLEREIIRACTDDGRKPFQAIARELGVDEKTVRNRVAKLRDNGILKFIPTANINRLEGSMVAIVAINITSDVRGDVYRVAKELSELPMVSWVGLVMGQYDIIAEVVVESWEALVKFELSELSALPWVGKSDSFLVLSQFGRRGVPFVDGILAPAKTD